jgi:hypothetical protein
MAVVILAYIASHCVASCVVCVCVYCCQAQISAECDGACGREVAGTHLMVHVVVDRERVTQESERA